jgi:hypothetical protein
MVLLFQNMADVAGNSSTCESGLFEMGHNSQLIFEVFN